MTRSLALLPLAALALSACQTLGPYGDPYGDGYADDGYGPYPADGRYPGDGYTQDGYPPVATDQWAAQPYRAIGTEPFWSLTIDSEAMRYEGADGDAYSVPTPEARPSFNGLRYVGDRMTVDVTYSECSDGMSNRRYSDSVTVQLPDGRDLRGCGGDILPPQNLAGTSWRVLSVNGLPVESAGAELRFDGRTVSGSTGCNRFSAAYVVDGIAVSFGPASSTRMACDPRVMGQERALLDLLAAAEAQPVGDRFRRLGAIRYAPNGNMILTAPDGRVAVLSQII